MKICGQCEFENEDEVKVCTQCGAELEDEVSEAEAAVSEAVEEGVNVSGTEEISGVDNVEETSEDITEAVDNIGETSEDITEAVDNVEETTECDDNGEEVTESEFIPIVEKKPVPKGVKTGVLAAVIVVAAAVLFYLFGSLAVLSKVGIINSARYMGIVQNKMIQETEEAPSVKLKDAFNKFFEKEAVADTEAVDQKSSKNAAVSWTSQKTADGVIVKAETVCTFDRKEDTVATYSVKLNFDGSVANEEFAASDKILDSEQTLSVLQKIARYSDPAKTEYTTKNLSSSKYNNREYYIPSGITLEMLAGDKAAEFLSQYGIAEDAEGTTDMTVLEKLIRGDKYAEMAGTTFDEMKTQLGLDETITPDMTWGKIQGETMIKNFGMTEENFAEFKEYYGFGDDVTLDTKYKDIELRMIKFQYDEMKRMEAEQKAAEEAPADESAEQQIPAEEVPADESAEQQVPAEEVPAE